KQSFIRGIGDLLEAGNHEDLRIYEFDLLPNAPANDPIQIKEFGIRTMEKQMYLVSPDTPPDECERVQLVVETNTLSKSDWIDCAIFSQLIQFLHNGCYTRYISMHLRRHRGIGYQCFYEHIQRFFSNRCETILGRILGRMESLYSEYVANRNIPQVNLVASQPGMLRSLERYGRRK